MAANGYFELGAYARSTSTDSEEAELWFNRGLLWTYGFNHEEAVLCFGRAAEIDPGFGLAHWGIAYASGPNYNKGWDAFEDMELAEALAAAFEAAERAKGLSAAADPAEAALIEAIAPRYEAAVPPVDAERWNREYAEAMRGVHRSFPEDLDIATIFADALMNLTPWALWDQSNGEPAVGSLALEAKEVLDRAMALEGGSEHPGLLHMYIHLMEMSGTPELALPAADALRGLVPDAGHLEHMGTHIDVLCGDYVRVIEANSVAIAADQRFRMSRGDANFYALYRAHNIHFKAYGAMFAGRRALALRAADELAEILPDEVLRIEVPPMADWLEGFLSVRLHVMVRFGIWDELLALELPADPELHSVTTAMSHYARGVAQAATGAVDDAARSQELLAESFERVPETRTLFNNTCRDILTVAASMLEGELLYRRGDHAGAFDSLRRSIELDDGLPYDEPWGWMQPVRHAYGALLLEQGHVEEAEAVYRADLGFDGTLSRACQHPGNVWSLHGYHECLTRLGRDGEAQIIARQLDLARARADVPIESSCFCRGLDACCD